MALLHLITAFFLFGVVVCECPSGWLRGGNHCYWVSPAGAVNFEDAQGVCSVKGALLVSLTTPVDLNATVDAARAVAGVTGVWTCLRFDPSQQQWAWLDKAPYNVTTTPWWGGKAPSLHSHASEMCAVLDPLSSVLHRNSCTEVASPVCRRSAFQEELCDLDGGWHNIGQDCLKVFSDKMTWWDAFNTCRDSSSSLLPLPFTDVTRSLIQQSVVCDTSDNDVWIDTDDVTIQNGDTVLSSSVGPTTSHAQCNFVSVQYQRELVKDSCLQEKKFICQKKAGYTCAEGWQYFEGLCYWTPIKPLPWLSASYFCGSYGAKLLIISNAIEQQFITSQMNLGKMPREMWLAISDMGTDGQFVWMDGSSVASPFSKWADNYPANTIGRMDCGIISLAVNGSTTWSNGYCYNSRPFVCEMSSGKEVNNQTNYDFCPAGWSKGMDKCYQIGSNRNYSDALDYCRTQPGGSLATVHSVQDLTSLAAIITQTSLAWIGLRRDALVNKQFVWADDGTTVTTSNWLPGEPNNLAGGEECVQMVGAAQRDMAGAWNDNDCAKPADFICQRPVGVSNTTPVPRTLVTSPWSWRCGEGWVLAHSLDTCYRLVKDRLVSWAAARAQCGLLGAHLASVASHLEQTQLEVMVGTAGLSSSEDAWSGIWIGATDNSREGGWEWSDGSPFRYLHWGDGEPDGLGAFGEEEQDCGAVIPGDNFSWDDRYCGEAHIYLCEKPAASLPTTPATGMTTPETERCEGWAILSGEYSVTDAQFSASSSNDSAHGPTQSRIFPANVGSWMPSSSDSKPWIVVVFETVVTIRGITTTGGLTQNAWVTSYALRYRYDFSAPPYWYTELPGSSDSKAFVGNNDSSTPVTHMLQLHFAARQLYLFPLHWSGPVPALRWELLGCLEDDCSPEYAVSGPLVVDDQNVTASSQSNAGHPPSRARLHPLAKGQQLGCWRPGVLDASQFIQVDFERIEVVRGVTLRGNPSAAEWVSSFLLMYTPATAHVQVFKPYEEPYGSVKVFVGNVDHNSSVTRYLKSPLPTRHVRLAPQTWNSYIALQFDILVCESGCQEHALLDSVSDEQLTASSAHSHHGAAVSRLDSDGWEAQFPAQDQFLQVSLDVPLEIRAVATGGRPGTNYWVTNYTLAWSPDLKTWYNYTQQNSQQPQVFPGNDDGSTIRKHYLPTPFVAQYVRLQPVSWHGRIGLRWELYGCPGMGQIRSVGCFTDHPEDRDLPYEPFIDALDGMDPWLCSRHCFAKGYYYAGIQQRELCFCGNSYGRYGAGQVCNLRCLPRDSYACGGYGANSVYATGLTAAVKVCPGGWTRQGDQCYSLSGPASDWTSARQACAAQHAQLASVADRAENLLLYSLIGTAGDQNYAWIGLSDLREPRYFEWSNREEVVYTDWDLHQPPPQISGDSRHCVAINNQTSGWVVLECSIKLPYLCRTEPLPSTQPPQTTPTPGCQPGMLGYSSSCYLLLDDTRPRSESADVCASHLGGHLVIVNDRLEQAYLTSLLSGHDGLYWTDVTDIHDPGRFTVGQGQADIPFSNWASNMPDSRRKGHCVVMGSGQVSGLWQNSPCDGLAKAICELPRQGYPRPTIPSSSQQQGSCSTNWIDTNSSLCYQVNNVGAHLQRSWSKARQDCAEQRGQLASFTDAVALKDFWRYKLLGSSNHFWVGLHALANGELQWTDHSAVNVANAWAPGQPDSSNGTSQCVELHVTSATLALRDCNLPRNWVCAIQKGIRPFQRLSDRIAPTDRPPGSCTPEDDTWKRYGDYCYKVYTSAATWRQARKTCQGKEGDLASISNMPENMFILKWAQRTGQRTVWIGLTELMNAAGYFGWSDGQQVPFTNWAGLGPDDAGGQESCAEMYVHTGKWNDNHCATAQGFVCKKYALSFLPSTPTPPPTSSDGGCLEGFFLFRDRCYRVLGQDGGKTWAEAVRNCSVISTPFLRVQLVSVRSHLDNALLSTHLFGSQMSVWIGLHLVNQSYLWEDNQDLTYTNWDVGQPAGMDGEACVHMYSEGASAGRWRLAQCSRALGWICESNLFTYSDVPPTPTTDCPPGYQRLGPSCYLYRSVEMQWSQAQHFCRSQRAHLASISSQAEQDFIFLLLSADPYPDTASVWIGLNGTRVGKSSVWTWTDGWPVTFTRWALGGDLSHNRTVHCAAMNYTGAWSSQDCNSSRSFVCKTTSASPPYTPVPGSGSCEGHDFIPFGADCYAFYLSQRLSFARADFECQQLGASLVSIHNNATNTFIFSLVKAGSSLPVWIGFRRSETEGFAWRDGTGVDFTNWAPSFPRGNTEDGEALRCAQMSARSGQWLDEECSASGGYICVKSKEFETTSPGRTSLSPTGRVQIIDQDGNPAPSINKVLYSDRGNVNYPTSTPLAGSPTRSLTPSSTDSDFVHQRSSLTAKGVPAVTSRPENPRTFTQSRLIPGPTTMHVLGGTFGRGPLAQANNHRFVSNEHDNAPPSHHQGAVAGGVAAAVVVVVVVLVVVAAFFLLRRLKARSAAGFTNVLYRGAAEEVRIGPRLRNESAADTLESRNMDA